MRKHEGGKFNLHAGVDISAVDGTPVYPVVDGRVQATCGSKSRKWVVVGAAAHRNGSRVGVIGRGGRGRAGA